MHGFGGREYRLPRRLTWPAVPSAWSVFGPSRKGKPMRVAAKFRLSTSWLCTVAGLVLAAALCGCKRAKPPEPAEPQASPAPRDPRDSKKISVREPAVKSGQPKTSQQTGSGAKGSSPSADGAGKPAARKEKPAKGIVDPEPGRKTDKPKKSKQTKEKSGEKKLAGKTAAKTGEPTVVDPAAAEKGRDAKVPGGKPKGR